jgi:hypothetical protein
VQRKRKQQIHTLVGGLPGEAGDDRQAYQEHAHDAPYSRQHADLYGAVLGNGDAAKKLGQREAGDDQRQHHPQQPTSYRFNKRENTYGYNAASHVTMSGCWLVRWGCNLQVTGRTF